MHRLIAAAVAAALAAAPVAASATTLPTIAVSLDGVNPDTDAGARTALKRIDRAARKACDSTPTGTRIKSVDAECVADLTATAVEKLAAPKVTALHNNKDRIRLARREQ